MTRVYRDGECRLVDRPRNIMNDERRFFKTISTFYTPKKKKRRFHPMRWLNFTQRVSRNTLRSVIEGSLRQGVRNVVRTFVVRLVERCRSDREPRENPRLTPCMTWHPLSREIDVISRGCERIVPVNGSTCRRGNPVIPRSFLDLSAIHDPFFYSYFYLLFFFYFFFTFVILQMAILSIVIS